MGAALSTVFTKRNEVAYRNLAVISPKQGEDSLVGYSRVGKQRCPPSG